MPKEQLEAEMVVTIDQASLKQSEQELKRLASPQAVKMAIDLGALKQQAVVVRQALKEALNPQTGDKNVATKLGGDLEILKKKITQANRELTNFVRTGDKEVSVLGKLFKQVGIDVESGMGRALLNASESMASFASKGLLLLGGGAIATGLYSIGKQAIFLGDKLEQATLSFTTMLGSASSAKQLLSDLTAFAQTTPFEILGIRDTAKQLLAFGFSADEIIPTLRSLGDVSAGLSVPIEQVAYAYGQVRTANQLYGTELRQFVNAGVPLLAQLAKQFGKTEAQVKKMVEDGEVSFKDVEKAFKGMTQFAGLMEAQATILSLLWSKLKDTITALLEKIGTALLPVAKALVQALQFLVDALSTTAGKAVAISLAIASVGALIVPLIAGLFGLAGAFTVASASGGILAGILAVLGGPVTLVIAGISALAGAVYYFTQKNNESSESADLLTKRMDSLVKKGEELLQSQEDLKKKYEEGKMTADEYRKAQEDLQAQMEANKVVTGEYKKALDILDDGNLTYIQKIEQINELELNRSQYDELINANRDAQNEIVKTLNLQKQLLMSQQKQDEAKTDSLGGSASGVGTQLPTAPGGSFFGIRLGQIEDEIKANTDMLKLGAEKIKKVKDDTEKKDAKTSKAGLSALKKAEAEKKRIYEDSIKFQKKLFESASKLREQDIKKTEEYIDTLQKGVDKINEIEKELADNNRDSSENLIEAGGKKYRELLEEQKKALQDIENDKATLRGEGYADFSLINPELQKNLDAVQAQIKEIEDSGILDPSTKLKEQQRASLSDQGQKRFDFQEDIGKIALEKANKEAELLRKKKEIEDNLGMDKYRAEEEIKIQERRKQANEIALSKYADMIALIDKGITDNTGKEIDKRMSLYAKEEQRLLRLIELRMQAGYAVGAIAPPPAQSTTNNTANVNVQANVANNIDMKQLANTLAREIITSRKL